MKAITVEPLKTGSARLEEVPEPDPREGSVLVEAIAVGITLWHKELAPAGDTTCVFRDSAFADDVAKTNMAAILEQNGIANVRSL